MSTYPSQYVGKAFEFSRQFVYHWSVNWKFVPEDVFLSKPFAHALLAAHLVGWASGYVRTRLTRDLERRLEIIILKKNK